MRPGRTGGHGIGDRREHLPDPLIPDIGNQHAARRTDRDSGGLVQMKLVAGTSVAIVAGGSVSRDGG